MYPGAHSSHDRPLYPGGQMHCSTSTARAWPAERRGTAVERETSLRLELRMRELNEARISSTSTLASTFMMSSRVATVGPRESTRCHLASLSKISKVLVSEGGRGGMFT